MDGQFPAVARSRLADHAYAVMLHKIVTGELGIGRKLPPEGELCTLFEVSRPVVREALTRLRNEGVIVSRRGSGWFVTETPAPDVSSSQLARKRREMMDYLEFRAVLEPQAAALAAERRTEADLEDMEEAIDRFARAALEGSPAAHLDFRFHVAVATGSHNEHFHGAIVALERFISHGINLMRFWSNFSHLERSRSVLTDHSRILLAIRQRKPEDARRAMRAHIESARMRVVEARPNCATTTANQEGQT